MEISIQILDGREGIVQKSVVFIWNENFQKRGIFLQFSIEFCFSGCLFLITNSKLVISVEREGDSPEDYENLPEKKFSIK